jgi:hypothetical protein
MKLDLTLDEILQDLCHNGLPPGHWNVPRGAAAILHESGELVGRVDLTTATTEEEQCQGLRRKSSSTTPRY